MIIGGFQKFSLIDYPGKTCAIIYTRGCNFRCPYCHNPELVLPEMFTDEIPFSDILHFLKNRRGLLEAVCITGGEPTIHEDLIDCIKRIRSLGFAIKLDSNGSNPKMLRGLIAQHLIDYAAMDVKAPLNDYSRVCCAEIIPDRIQESIRLLLQNKIDYEFRTTVDTDLLNEKDLHKTGQMIKGAKRYYLQKLNPHNTKKSKGNGKQHTEEWLIRVAQEIAQNVGYCAVRA